MLHVYYGEDDYSIRRAVEAVKAGMGDATELMTNSTTLDGKSVSPAELRNACETVPFLAEKRLVVVEGLLEKFENGARNGRKKASKKKKNDDEPAAWEAYAAIAQGLPDFTELIIISGKVSEKNPLLTAIKGVGDVKGFPPLRPAELTRWVMQRVAEEGGNIEPKAVDTLAKFVGNDLWLLSNEITKLVQYAGDKTVTAADVQELVSSTQEANIFAMVDAILEGRTARAQDLYAHLLDDGAAPTQVLTMIARQVRIIYQMKDMRARKKGLNDIRGAIGVASDFLLRKAADQAATYSPERLKDIYHRLLDTDLAIKTGKYDGELALSIFIADMGTVRRR